MSRMNIELFAKDTELISFEQSSDGALMLNFGREVDGYVALGAVTVRIKGRSCAVDTRRIPDGEYIPHLILADRTVDLPGVKKQHGAISPSEPDSSYITKLSARERRLSERVDELEKRLDEINKRIVGSSLFSTAP